MVGKGVNEVKNTKIGFLNEFIGDLIARKIDF